MRQQTKTTTQNRIEYVDPGVLRLTDYNPRTMSEKELADLERSVDEFGLVDPIIVRRAGKQPSKTAPGRGRPSSTRSRIRRLHEGEIRNLRATLEAKLQEIEETPEPLASLELISIAVIEPLADPPSRSGL